MDERAFSLARFPPEILECIFSSEELDYIDICRLCSVCRIFNEILKNNKIWELKYKDKWEELTKFYDAKTTNWKAELRFKHECQQIVSHNLQEMAEELYHQDKISDDSFGRFCNLGAGHPISDHIVCNELEKIVFYTHYYKDLTKKYYANKALRHMRHKILGSTWHSLIEQVPQRITLLTGACLISRWCQSTKHDAAKVIYSEMGILIWKVYSYLYQNKPLHPVLKMPSPELKFGNSGPKIEESLWDTTLCKQILHAINEVMYKEYFFSGNTEDFYCSDNSYLDKVLQSRKGIPITLSIVYQTIAAVFGVALLPVNFPGHFLLKWKEFPLLPGLSAYTFIDAFDNGKQKRADQLQDLAPGYERFADEWVEEVSPLKVFIRMCWNLVEVGRQQDTEGQGVLVDALELLAILSPDDNEHKLLLARVYMHLSINMTQVISLLQDISYQDPASTGTVGFMYRSAITQLESQRIQNRNVTLKCNRRGRRSDPVDFAVGMIMKHKKYDYRCVIYGWDRRCVASADWIRQMGVQGLKYKDKQPFYHVLVEDGTNRYAAQENLEIVTDPEMIDHVEVGRFFESFHHYHYMPNAQKRREYPDDVDYRKNFFPELNE